MPDSTPGSNESAAPSPDPAGAAHVEAIEAEFRQMLPHLVVRTAPLAHLEVTLEHARELRRTLEQSSSEGALWGKATTGDGLRGMIVLGHAAPPPEPSRMSAPGDRIEALVTFEQRHRGPDGAAHGGYVAHVYDDLLAAVQSLTGSQYGLTTELSVRYHRKTPLERPLRFECEVESAEPGQTVAAGRCFDGDVLVSEARATFRVVGRSGGG